MGVLTTHTEHNWGHREERIREDDAEANNNNVLERPSLPWRLPLETNGKDDNGDNLRLCSEESKNILMIRPFHRCPSTGRYKTRRGRYETAIFSMCPEKEQENTT